MAPLLLGGLVKVAEWAMDRASQWQQRRDAAAAHAEALAAEERAAEIAAAKRAAESADAWDKYWSEGAAHSWKDEAWTIVFLALFVANFIPWPGLQAAIDAGLDRFAKLPDWLAITMGVAVAAAFGVRSVVDVFKARNGGK